jgi:hypothetical protein
MEASLWCIDEYIVSHPHPTKRPKERVTVAGDHHVPALTWQSTVLEMSWTVAKRKLIRPVQDDGRHAQAGNRESRNRGACAHDRRRQSTGRLVPPPRSVPSLDLRCGLE